MTILPQDLEPYVEWVEDRCGRAVAYLAAILLVVVVPIAAVAIAFWWYLG
ncbi:hypothetical protein [Sphingomonas sp.]|nr:hypothetical protein [Sphingomonas sp.]MBX3592963.1 hypothetical protein [Sphingomonas sp.]